MIFVLDNVTCVFNLTKSRKGDLKIIRKLDETEQFVLKKTNTIILKHDNCPSSSVIDLIMIKLLDLIALRKS